MYIPVMATIEGMIFKKSHYEHPSIHPWTGRCEKAMTNAGPTLFLPTKGGMEAVLPSAADSFCSYHR